MATCSSCFKQIPDNVAACPHCGTAQAAKPSGEGARTMFGYAPTPEQLRAQIEGQPQQQPQQPQPQQAQQQQPLQPLQPQHALQPPDDPSTAQTMFAPSTAAPARAPMGAPPAGAPMGAPPAGAPMGAPPAGAPMGAPPAGAPSAPPMAAPMGAPPMAAPMGAPPMAAPVGAPPSAAASQGGIVSADRPKSGGVWLVLAIVGIVMSAAAVGTLAYAALETYPNYRSARRRYILGSALRRYGSRYRSRYRSSYSSGGYLYRSYRDTLKQQMVFGIWGPGGIALILGLLCVIKRRLLGLVPLGLSVVAIGVSLFVQPSW